MDSIDVKIEKTDDKEAISLLAQISLGTISKQKGIDEKYGKYITMPLETKFVMSIMEENLFRYIDTVDVENIQELRDRIRGFMQEYAKAYMLNMLGVEHTPIMRDDSGNLIGFQKGYEVNIIKE